MNTLRYALAGILAITAVASFPSPASADRDWRWHRHEWHPRHWEHRWHYRPYAYSPYYAPPPVTYPPRGYYYRYGW